MRRRRLLDDPGDVVLRSALPASLGPVDFGQAAGYVLEHALLIVAGHIAAGTGTDIPETIPFIHAEFTHADFYIQAKVAFWTDVALK